MRITVTSTLWRTFGPAFAVSSLYQLGYSFLQFASPQIVNLLIGELKGYTDSFKALIKKA